MSTASEQKVVYWHRELPPIDSETIGEHVVEAASTRVKGDLDDRGTLWGECHDKLMTNLESRLRQELSRLGGDYAHVTEESIESHRDEATGEAWLQGRLTYSLLRRVTPK